MPPPETARSSFLPGRSDSFRQFDALSCIIFERLTRPSVPGVMIASAPLCCCRSRAGRSGGSGVPKPTTVTETASNTVCGTYPRHLKLKTNLKASATKVRYVDSETAL
jgi:hypothetical protein